MPARNGLWQIGICESAALPQQARLSKLASGHETEAKQEWQSRGAEGEGKGRGRRRNSEGVSGTQKHVTMQDSILNNNHEGFRSIHTTTYGQGDIGGPGFRNSSRSS
eukprot:1160545-Pelagomonas_calceolata.AAC.28